MNYVFVYRMLYLANGYFIALQSTNRGSSILPKWQGIHVGIRIVDPAGKSTMYYF